MAKRISIDDLPAVIDNFLRDATQQERAALEAEAEAVATACMEELRRTSPRSEGVGEHYADGWMVETMQEDGVKHHIVKNPKYGWKTGVLENGTGLRKTKAGRNRGIMPPRPHFVVAVREAINRMRERIKQS